MNPADEREEVLFREALQRAMGPERENYLSQVCAGDPALRARLEALLQAHESPDPFLEPLAAPPSAAVALRPEEGPGTVIGRYKLLEQIGEGGCGVVYMAEQEAPMRRRVALKIIKLGMDTKQVVARFEAERQALAMMDHPNIATVLDGGATETGRPYFVMELVRGVRITDYCDQNNLPTVERLKLFVQVCHAIQHAHQKGIIHRDIKPSNILVSLHDDVAVPKVIDFGIAKAMGERLTDKTVFTRFDQFIGTPAYMSPEQAGVSGLDIDTRSDIYALGVLLYELLTGRTPFDPKQLAQAGLEEILRRIREEEPPKPSTRLSALERAELTTTAQQRQTEPPRLISLLRGDLDWIVMKCLEKNRTRRYETANALAIDIEHHLTHQPVTAAAPSTFYRARKFIRRHRLGLGFAAALALALATGLSLFIWMFLKEKQARQRLEVRAYVADMGTAMRTAERQAEMGGVVRLLAPWQNHKPDLRGWEWYYLNGLCHAEILAIRADTNDLLSVAWSPDGTRLATGGIECAVKIWDARSGRQLACLRGHAGEVTSVAWSPDALRLASASVDMTVKLWNLETGREASTLRGHSERVHCVAWSPDGARLASGGKDQTVKIWDPVSGANTQTLPAQMAVLSLSWTSDGKRLAAAGLREKVKVWELSSGRELWGDQVPDSTGPLFCAWSPDGTRLATGGNGPAVTIRDATTGTNIKNLSGYGPYSSVAWATGGRWLVAASLKRGMLRIWDTMTGREVRSFVGHVGGISSVCWRTGGSRIASAGLDGTVRVWDATKPNPSVTTLQEAYAVVCLAWHPDGNKLATGSRSASARIFDLTRRSSPSVVPGQAKWTDHVAWNPAGTRLACGYTDGVLRVWDPASQTEVWHVQVSTNHLGSLAWGPDSHRLASSAEIGTNVVLNIWDAATGEQLSAFSLRPGGRALAWSPDGSYLAVGAYKDIQILDAVTGTERRLLKGHADGVASVAWSPDGKRLASAATDASVRIWDAASGREIRTLLGHAGPVRTVAWHPDGTRLVSTGGGDGLILWEPASGLAICLLSGHEKAVTSVAWSPDGTRLASADGIGLVRILDAAPGRAAEEKQKRARLARAETENQPQVYTPLSRPEEAIEWGGADTNAGASAMAEALLGRAALLQRTNRLAEAAADRSRALQIPPRDPRAGTNLIDLSSFYNAGLDEDWDGLARNNMAALPHGVQTLAQVEFDVRGLIQLTGTELQARLGNRYSASVAGIPIHRKFARLHALHGTGWWADEAAMRIGAYVLHYADGRQCELPILYGQDVQDWWHYRERWDVSRATVAWTGSNPAVRAYNGDLRLFKRTWDNPRPEVEVESIDFTSAVTRCSPFLIALTLE